MHRIKAILFDIDDTLYDLSIPFKEAFREFFPGGGDGSGGGVPGQQEV